MLHRYSHFLLQRSVDVLPELTPFFRLVIARYKYNMFKTIFLQSQPQS